MDIELSLPNCKKNHSTPKQFGIRFIHCYFQCAGIRNSVKHYCAACLRKWSSTPRPRNYQMFIGGGITRFLGMRLLDSSHSNTVARALLGRCKIVKYCPVCIDKKVGDHCLSVYLRNTYYRYKKYFGEPTAFSVMCS